MQTRIPMAVLLGALALGLSTPLSPPALAASAEVEALVSDMRPSAELSDPQLRQRMQTLRSALDQTTLSDAVRREIRNILRADRTEQETRTANAGGEPAANSPRPSNPRPIRRRVATATHRPAPKTPGRAPRRPPSSSLVSSTGSSADLSDEALQGRLAEIEAGLTRGELPRTLKRQLRDMQQADQAEMERRRQSVAAEQPAEEPVASAAPADEPVASDDPPQDEPVATTSADEPASQDDSAAVAETAAPSGNSASDARQLLLSTRALDRMSERDLRQRLSDARQLLSDRSLPGALKGKLTDLSAKLRNEIRRRGGSSTVANGVLKPKKKVTTASSGDDGGVTVATTRKKPRVTDADRRALALINDTARPERLPRPVLRKRLDTYRDLLASGQLSPEVENNLRVKLKRERSLLRERVAVEEVQAGETTASTTTKRTRVAVKVAVPEPTVSEAPRLANDKRRATELNERQLNRRIMANRVLNRGDRVSAAERVAYRERLRADRAELRRSVCSRISAAASWKSARRRACRSTSISAAMPERRSGRPKPATTKSSGS